MDSHREIKDKRTCDTESSDTGNWVTTSRKEGTRGCRKHLGAILAYLFSKQQRANHSSGARGPRWTGRCQECFGPGGNSFIHSCLHSLIHSLVKFKFRSLVPMWASCHVYKWPKNGLSGNRINFICAKNSSSHDGAGSSAPFSHVHRMKLSKYSPVLLFSKAPMFSLGNMFQCLIIPTMKLFCRIENLFAFYCKNSNVFVNDNKTLKNCKNSHIEVYILFRIT